MVVEGLKMLLLLPTWKRRWVCRVYAKQVWSANVRRCCHHCRRYIRIDSASVEFCRRCRNGIRPRQRALCWAITNEPALCHRWYGHTRMERIRHRIRVYLATTCSLPAEAYRSPKSYHPPIRERRNNRMTHTIFCSGVKRRKDRRRPTLSRDWTFGLYKNLFKSFLRTDTQGDGLLDCCSYFRDWLVVTILYRLCGYRSTSKS